MHCSPQFYIQLGYKAALSFTLRIQIVSSSLFFVHENMKKTTFKIGNQTTQTVELIFSNVAYRATVCKTGLFVQLSCLHIGAF